MVVVPVPRTQVVELSHLAADMSLLLEQTRRHVDAISEKKKRVAALVDPETGWRGATETDTDTNMDMEVVVALERSISAVGAFRARILAAMGRGDGEEHLSAAASATSTESGGASAAGSSPPRHHEHVLAMESPRVFVPGRSGAGPTPSRRVVLGGLPPDTNARQVLCAVGRCHGGVASVVVLDDPAAEETRDEEAKTTSKTKTRTKTRTTKTAVVEFVYPRAAADFASRAQPQTQPLAV
ncbi:hypothetical protein E4U54_007541, partial [Claviceps lovelessii]